MGVSLDDITGGHGVEVSCEKQRENGQGPVYKKVLCSACKLAVGRQWTYERYICFSRKNGGICEMRVHGREVKLDRWCNVPAEFHQHFENVEKKKAKEKKASEADLSTNWREP